LVPEILPKDTLPNDILPDGHFAVGHFAVGHFAEGHFGKVSFGKMSGHLIIKYECVYSFHLSTNNLFRIIAKEDIIVNITNLAANVLRILSLKQ
jgi:hypothetical protein